MSNNPVAWRHEDYLQRREPPPPPLAKAPNHTKCQQFFFTPSSRNEQRTAGGLQLQLCCQATPRIWLKIWIWAFFPHKLRHNYAVICAETAKEWTESLILLNSGYVSSTECGVWERGLISAFWDKMYWSLHWNVKELHYRIMYLLFSDSSVLTP